VTYDAAVKAEREIWLRLTKYHRCCGELLRPVLGPDGISFHCKPCGAVWIKNEETRRPEQEA